jgi:hypothetical protein
MRITGCRTGGAGRQKRSTINRPNAKEHEMRRKQTYPLGMPGSRLPVRSVSMLAIIALGGTAFWGAGSAPADPSAGHDATAIAARRIAVHETVHATNVSHQGNTVINERGRGTGTFECPLTLLMRVHYTKGTTKLICKVSSGSVTAEGGASFFSAGGTATFTGTMAVTDGTGKYAHAQGRLHVEGTLQRKTYVLEATVSGSITY